MDTNVKTKGICYIVAACCSDECKNIKKRKNDIIIAVDYGYKILTDHQISPDIVIGDFDSLSYAPTHTNTLTYPSEKDETDTFLAVREGLNLGYSFFVILGGIGGERLDHTLANLQTLSYIAKNGGRGVLSGENTIITVLHNDFIELPTNNSGYISVFSLDNISEKVTIDGLKYCIQDATLTSSYPVGVSNEFTGKKAVISVKNGTLLITWKENSKHYLNNL